MQIMKPQPWARLVEEAINLGIDVSGYHNNGDADDLRQRVSNIRLREARGSDYIETTDANEILNQEIKIASNYLRAANEYALAGKRVLTYEYLQKASRSIARAVDKCVR